MATGISGGLLGRLQKVVTDIVELGGEAERSRAHVGAEVLANSGSGTPPPANFVLVRIDGVGTLARYFGDEPNVGDYVTIINIANSIPIVLMNHTQGLSAGWPFLRVITVDPTDPDADYTTIQAAVNAATTLEDVILISPNAYNGFTCAKTLTFVGMGSHVDFGTSAPHTRVGTPVALTGDDIRFVGLYFLDTVTIQKPVEFIFCGFEEATAIQSHATISIGRIRLVDCFVEGDIDMSPGVGMDVELVRTFVDGNIDMGGKSLSLWSTDIDGTVTNVATRTNYDGPHIQRAMFGPDVLTVGTEGAMYATAAAAVAAVSAGQAIFFQEGTWACDGVVFPADITVFGQDRERTILQTTTTAPTLTLGVGDYFYNLTIKNEQSSVGFIAAVRAPISGSATLQDCLIICNNTRAIGVDPAYGTYMDATYDGNIVLINTDVITSTASALGWSLAAYANQNATVEVHGGRLDAGTVGVSVYDAYAANVVGATVALYGAVVVNGAIGTAGANGVVRGWRYDSSNNLFEVGDEANYTEIDSGGDTVFVGGAGLIFGSCWGNHIGWQQVGAVQNTWYNISDGNITSGQLHGVTHDGNGMLTVTEPGKYLVSYSLCFQDDKANDHVEAGIEVNSAGAARLPGQSHLENKFASEEEHMSSSAILDLADNATLEVCIRTTDGAPAPTIDVQAVNLTCVQVGGT